MHHNSFAARVAVVFLFAGSFAAPAIAHEQPHEPTTFQDGNLIVSYVPFLVTSDAPGSRVVTPGGNPFGLNTDGVARLSLTAETGGTFTCTGSLLSTGRHILTAAHCVTDASGNEIINTVAATFQTPGGPVVTTSGQITVHPQYDGNVIHGYDVAVITLAAPVSPAVPRYELFRQFGSEGGGHVKVGYGRTGQGATGHDQGFFDGLQRAGLNRYEDQGLPINGILNPQTQLTYDYDSGSAANDAFNFFFGDAPNLGFGPDEVSAAPGDSGGPTFLLGADNVFRIAGVTSYGLSLSNTSGTSSDADRLGPQPDSSFGEFGGDARVAEPSVLAFIDSVVPEPSSFVLMAVLTAGLINRRRRAA